MAKSMWTLANSVIVEHLIPKPWAVIQYGAIAGSTFVKILEPGCRNFGVQFIPKVLELRVLCRAVKLGKPFLYGPHFVHGGIFMMKHERVFPKKFPQSWKHTIV